MSIIDSLKKFIAKVKSKVKSFENELLAFIKEKQPIIESTMTLLTIGYEALDGDVKMATVLNLILEAFAKSQKISVPEISPQDVEKAREQAEAIYQALKAKNLA